MTNQFIRLKSSIFIWFELALFNCFIFRWRKITPFIHNSLNSCSFVTMKSIKSIIRCSICVITLTTYDRQTEHFWAFHFEMEFRFQNGASISKWSLDFNLKVLHETFCTEKRHVIWVHVFLHLGGFYCGQSSLLADQRRERNGKWWNETISKGSKTSV